VDARVRGERGGVESGGERGREMELP
jgi:hypothetical protein